MSNRMTPKEYENWLKQQTEKTVAKPEEKTEKIIAEKVEEKPKETVEESATDYMKRRNKEKSMEPKETVEDVMRRDKAEAIEKFREIHSKEKTPNLESAKALEDMKTAPMSKEKINNDILSVEQALFAMTDRAFQKGLEWRMGQARAVRSLIANGWDANQILREFRHNGMTQNTARKIIDDAIC